MTKNLESFVLYRREYGKFYKLITNETSIEKICNKNQFYLKYEQNIFELEKETLIVYWKNNTNILQYKRFSGDEKYIYCKLDDIDGKINKIFP